MDSIKISEATGELKPFIRYFLLREFDTLGQEWQMPCFARNECFIPFCLESRYQSFTRPDGTGSAAGADVRQPSLALGLSTQLAGTVIHNGYYRIFYIQFTANGFYSIFGIPSHLFTNCFFDLTSVVGNDARLLLQQLQEAPDLPAMVAHAENFLLLHFRKQKRNQLSNGIQQLSSLLQLIEGHTNIEQLANMANMSQRTLERKFAEQVGIGPKMYTRIARFNKALRMKLQQPDLHWTKIAHTCQYYDQMHMVKEFKQFTGHSPSFFTKDSLPLAEHFLTL
jgi:AraC-like DNA-binding protein